MVALTLQARILGECSTMHSRLCYFLFIFKVGFSSRTLIPLFMPKSVHSGSASGDDCSQMFPDRLRVSSFPDRFSHWAWTAAQSAHTDFDWLRSGIPSALTTEPNRLTRQPAFISTWELYSPAQPAPTFNLAQVINGLSVSSPKL